MPRQGEMFSGDNDNTSRSGNGLAGQEQLGRLWHGRSGNGLVGGRAGQRYELGGMP